MKILDKIAEGVYQTKCAYSGDVEVVILISHPDYMQLRHDTRDYLFEIKPRETRVYGCLLIRTGDLEEGDIRFLAEVPQ